MKTGKVGSLDQFLPDQESILNNEGILDPENFQIYQQQDLAKLKIETRLKQLCDYAQSKDLKWRK